MKNLEIKKSFKRIFYSEDGQMFILATIVLGLLLINVVVIVSNSLLFKQNSTYNIEASEANNLAEAGIDKAVASLNTNGGNYTGETNTPLGAGTFTVKITSSDSNNKVIDVTGYIPNSSRPVARREIKVQLSRGIGTAFNYATQVGEGGFVFGNGSKIDGSVYSNGNITGGNNNEITGDAWVAGGAQPTPDQQNDCNTPNCLDFVFGTNVGGNSQLDVAQSFQLSSTSTLNKVSLKLKKTGSPSDVTVRILGDSSGKPNKANIITSGTLSASLVSTSYSFVDVAFSSSPALVANTPYWIVIDTSSDTKNYWSWSEDSSQGYTRGSAYWSPDWQAGSPNWNFISGDLGFKAYVGGVITQVSLGNGSFVDGSVHSNTINGITIKKDAYYQTLINSTVQGVKYPNSADPSPQVFPISDANISDWKSEAASMGVSTGDITGCPSTLGPGEIVGNVTLGNCSPIKVETPIYITGNLNTGNGTIFNLDSSFGAASGNIITDGIVNFGNTADIRGSGTSGSYLLLLTTYDSRHNGNAAMILGNSTISGILYAPYGIISIPNNMTVKDITAWQLTLGNGTILDYDSGLSGVFFSSGPSGGFSVVKGTYQTK